MIHYAPGLHVLFLKDSQLLLMKHDFENVTLLTTMMDGRVVYEAQGNRRDEREWR